MKTRYSLAIASLALLAEPSAAATFDVSVNGALTSALNQGGQFDFNGNTGIDPNLSVGSAFTLTAQFDSSLILPWTNGDSIVGLWGLPTTGGSFWRIDAGGMTWQSSDDQYDGSQPFSTSPHEAVPAIIFSGDKVVGLLSHEMSPAGSSARPELYLGDGTDAAFSVSAADGRYGDFYNTPGFIGVWDFADSSVVDPPSADTAAVPEPETWALFLIGFGIAGLALRARRKTLAAVLAVASLPCAALLAICPAQAQDAQRAEQSYENSVVKQEQARGAALRLSWRRFLVATHTFVATNVEAPATTLSGSTTAIQPEPPTAPMKDPVSIYLDSGEALTIYPDGSYHCAHKPTPQELGYLYALRNEKEWMIFYVVACGDKRP